MARWVLFSMLLLALSSAQAERKALLIGNANYQARPLKNPLNDINAMRTKLTSLGFRVTPKTNLNRAQIREQIRLFSAQLKAGDEALFYFSGHGAQVDGKNYLIPLGNDIQSEDEVSDEAVPLNFVLNKLTGSSARLNIVILDACRDNPFQRRFKSGTRGLARLNRRIKGTIVAFAASAGGVSADGDNANGTYTQYLLQHLATPNITLNQMFNRVRADVDKATGGSQFPIEENGLLSDVYLVRQQVPPEPVPPVVVVDQPPQVVAKPVIKPPQVNQTKRSIEPTMKLIRGGSFLMGSPANEKGRFEDERQHRVSVKDFWLGQYEVTFAEWDACVTAGGCTHKPNDEGWGRGQRPVINVSWNDAQGYIRWLNKQTGKSYRLPTEAEWEYAARAGSKAVYAWGDKINCNLANYGSGFLSNQCKTHRTKPVASYKAYGGLYDMHGNVWEWTCSAYDKNYRGAESRCATAGGTYRVVRGGSWNDRGRFVRSAVRSRYSPDYRHYYFGLRLALGHPSSSRQE